MTHTHHSYAAVAGRIAQMCAYAQDSENPFTPRQMSDALEVHYRTTLRYLHALEASGFLERVGIERMLVQSYWQAGPRLRALGERR